MHVSALIYELEKDEEKRFFSLSVNGRTNSTADIFILEIYVKKSPGKLSQRLHIRKR